MTNHPSQHEYIYWTLYACLKIWIVGQQLLHSGYIRLVVINRQILEILQRILIWLYELDVRIVYGIMTVFNKGKLAFKVVRVGWCTRKHAEMFGEYPIALVFTLAQHFSTCRIARTTKLHSSEFQIQIVDMIYMSIHWSPQSNLVSVPI